MAQIHQSVATLRIMGENLIPSEITSLLRCKPSHVQEKGQELIGPKTGRKRLAKIGMWRLEATKQSPENIEAQIFEILNRLSSEEGTWDFLADRYEIDLFCGIFMKESNEGMEISPKALKALGNRGIILSLDIYDGNE
jgi:hypothetical protein